ncbi:MAG: nucleotidyltransferase domain-containing protein [Candidatus Taylorbacteria bacterium]|nr:nucleotidyltransferase domain-containing protein [Candidatus Taylorbacteria bacterium]
MSKNGAKEIVEKYADKLKKNRIPLSGLYLFGSFAKGEARKWSDIDVAVFSRRKETDNFIIELGRLVREVDLRIEPHIFSEKDLKTVSTPFVEEILRTGIKVV